MRIGVDYRSVLTTGAGIARYTKGLCTGLAGRLVPPDELRLYAFLARARSADWPPGPAVVARAGRVPARLVGWLGHLGYGAETHFGDVDLFHFTDFAPLPLRRTPWALTLHDLSFRRNPEWHEPRAVRALERVVARLVPTARAIFVHSNHTRDEVVRELGVAATRVFVAPLGVDDAYRDRPPESERARVARELGLPGRYVLCLGTLEPRKNLPAAIAAFERVHRSDAELKLLIVGARGWLDEPIFRAIESSPAHPAIRWLGHVGEARLPAVVAGAAALVYVSLYEGFGLPALEALALGVPAVVSDTTSLPEVVGDAALSVDPTDPDAIADALHLAVAAAAVRDRLRAAGPVQASRFTWARTADSTIAGYHRALEETDA